MDSAATIGSGVVIRRSSIPGGGNGLWTARPFRKHELITEYCGGIIDHKQALALRSLNKHSHVRVLNSQYMYIDGIKRPKAGLGGASFANDARDPAQNNAVFFCRHDNKLGCDRVFLKAARDLPPGTEVFVGYGRDYWRSSSMRPAAAAAAAAPRSPEQACTGSGSGTGSGEDEAEQQQLAGGLSLTSAEDGEQLQQLRKCYPTRQQQQMQLQQSQQQQQELPPMEAHSQQQQKQQHEAPPGWVAPAGQGQLGWVGSGLPHPYAGQAAANGRHPSSQGHMLPHLHQQQPVQDAAAAATPPVEPWQLAAALAPSVLLTRQGALGVVESAADTDSAGLVNGSSKQGTRKQRSCVLAYTQQQHKRQGSLDSNEAECSQDGGGRLIRGRQQQRTCLPTSRLQQQHHEQQQQHSRREVSLDSSEAEECAFAADEWQQDGTQEAAAAAAAVAAAAAGAVPGAVGLDGQVGSGSCDDMQQQQQQQWRSWLVTQPQWHSDSGDAAHGAVGLLQDGQQDDADWQPPGRGSSRGGSRRKFKKKEPSKKKPKTRRSCMSVYKDNHYPLKRAADPYRRVYTHSREGGLQPGSQGASSKPEGASSKGKQKRMKRPADTGLYKRVYTQRRHRRLPNPKAAGMVE